MAPAQDGLIEVLLGALLGAFCGLLGGFVLSHLFRYLSFMTGRHLGGFGWVIYGTLAGALIVGCLAATGEKS